MNKTKKMFGIYPFAPIFASFRPSSKEHLVLCYTKNVLKLTMCDIFRNVIRKPIHAIVPFTFP